MTQPVNANSILMAAVHILVNRHGQEPTLTFAMLDDAAHCACQLADSVAIEISRRPIPRTNKTRPTIDPVPW